MKEGLKRSVATLLASGFLMISCQQAPEEKSELEEACDAWMREVVALADSLPRTKQYGYGTVGKGIEYEDVPQSEEDRIAEAVRTLAPKRPLGCAV